MVGRGSRIRRQRARRVVPVEWPGAGMCGFERRKLAATVEAPQLPIDASPRSPALASESEQEHHGRVVYFVLPPIRCVIAAAHLGKCRFKRAGGWR